MPVENFDFDTTNTSASFQGTYKPPSGYLSNTIRITNFMLKKKIGNTGQQISNITISNPTSFIGSQGQFFDIEFINVSDSSWQTNDSTYSYYLEVSFERYFSWAGWTSGSIEGIQLSLEHCFLKGTPILTDQGEISIENITTGNTIRGIKVIGVIKTLNKRNHVIKIKQNAISIGIPSIDTYISDLHGIFVNNLLIRAENLINNDSITQEQVNDRTLYNVILETWSYMYVNNMKVETFNVECPYANRILRMYGFPYNNTILKDNQQSLQKHFHDFSM